MEINREQIEDIYRTASQLNRNDLKKLNPEEIKVLSYILKNDIFNKDISEVDAYKISQLKITLHQLTKNPEAPPTKEGRIQKVFNKFQHGESTYKLEKKIQKKASALGEVPSLEEKSTESHKPLETKPSDSPKPPEENREENPLEIKDIVSNIFNFLPLNTVRELATVSPTFSTVTKEQEAIKTKEYLNEVFEIMLSEHKEESPEDYEFFNSIFENAQSHVNINDYCNILRNGIAKYYNEIKTGEENDNLYKDTKRLSFHKDPILFNKLFDKKKYVSFTTIENENSDPMANINAYLNLLNNREKPVVKLTLLINSPLDDKTLELLQKNIESNKIVLLDLFVKEWNPEHLAKIIGSLKKAEISEFSLGICAEHTKGNLSGYGFSSEIVKAISKTLGDNYSYTNHAVCWRKKT